MIILWVLPLSVIAVSGMLLMILRGKPKCVRSNAHQLSILGMSASALISLARVQIPSFEIIIFAWCAATIVALSVSREIIRSSGAA